ADTVIEAPGIKQLENLFGRGRAPQRGLVDGDQEAQERNALRWHGRRQVAHFVSLAEDRSETQELIAAVLKEARNPGLVDEIKAAHTSSSVVNRTPNVGSQRSERPPSSP